jgi:hypothetical protein
MNTNNSNGSYVRAQDIGGVNIKSAGENWARYAFGVDTSFNFPTSYPGPSRLTNSSSFAASSEGQAWAAQQTLLQGWTPDTENLFNTLYSTSYPNTFISNNVLAPGMYTASMGTIQSLNMGQIYLQNCFLYTFINWPFSENQLVNGTSVDGVVVPIGSRGVGMLSIPLGIRCDTKQDLLEGESNKKYGRMIFLAYHQAIVAPDGLGCLGNSLIYIINHFENQGINWVDSGFGDLFKDWYNIIKTRYGKIN